MIADYACFAIWEAGRGKEQEILADIKSRFDVLGNVLVHWTDKHYNRNVARLYESNSGDGPFKKYSKKIGRTPFRFIVVRDNTPTYVWKQSVSGTIEPCNRDVFDAKYRYREWLEKDFQVHSSNNRTEFFLQAPLILGTDLFERALAGSVGADEIKIHKDLEGAEGWASWDDLFKVLRYANDYLVLRGFEGLPQSLGADDIDLLTKNFQRLASTMNVWQSKKVPYKGRVTVAGNDVHVDIRFVGDGYYPAAWAKDLLQNKVEQGGFFVPSDEDLFFSLLYHCAVQKPDFKESHRQTLLRIAADKRFDWFSESVFDDAVAQAGILSGYMAAQGYFYTPPVDPKVYVRAAVQRELPSIEKLSQPRSRIARLVRKVKTITGLQKEAPKKF